jgi:hypothetical protein
MKTDTGAVLRKNMGACAWAMLVGDEYLIEVKTISGSRKGYASNLPTAMYAAERMLLASAPPTFDKAKRARQLRAEWALRFRGHAPLFIDTRASARR